MVALLALRWRWVAEVAVLALAAGAVYLLLDRGVAADAATAGVDPVAASAPLLVALSAAALVARLFPLLVHERPLAAVVSTHDPLLVGRADRVLELHDGRVGRRGRHAAPGVGFTGDRVQT